MSDSPALRKARGAFFTPPELCRYLARWAVRTPSDRVLEPSCGDAEFLLAAGERLRQLGAATPSLTGVEVHHGSLRAARHRLAQATLSARLHAGDFFDLQTAERYDAVVGNPPYVRYQDFAGLPRDKSRALALRYRVPLTGLASSWAAFTVHAVNFLTDEGRLGLVLPAELLSVNYAAPIRSFLLRRFARVRLVFFEARVFPRVLEEVVLLLAEGTGGTDHFEVVQAQSVDDLERHLIPTVWSPAAQGAKWLRALLSVDAAGAYTTVTQAAAFATLHGWGETTLGMVTGDNRFFTLTPQQVAQFQLRSDEVLPISPPGSTHLRALSFTATAWKKLGDAGRPTYLFRPRTITLSDLSTGARRYIATGEREAVSERYKCRVRSPWWRVPLVAAPDLFLTYMNDQAPQLATNRGRLHHLNSVHGVIFHPGRGRLGRLLPLAALNTATLLGAELVGRAYGGGILKLEPKEADALPVPGPALLAERAGALRAIRPQVLRLLRAGQLSPAAALVDDALFAGQIDVGTLASLRRGRAQLLARRRARSTKT